LHLKSGKAFLNSYVSTIVRKNKYKSGELSLILVINKEGLTQSREKSLPTALLGRTGIYCTFALFAKAF
jgi:hypothetical protein